MSSDTVTTFPRDETGEPVPGQIYLQPIAAPSIPKLFGFSGATFMVAGHMAHCCDNAMTDLHLAPSAATFGSLTQFTTSRSDRRRRTLPNTDAGGWYCRTVLDRATSPIVVRTTR